MFNESKPAGFLIHRKNSDAVVPAIRTVKKFPGRMQHDFSSSVVRDKILRQRGNRLHLGHRRVRGGVAEHRDRAAHFVDDVNEFAVMGKNQMARAGAGRHGRERRIARRQFGGVRIQMIDGNLVQTEIAIEREAIVRRRQNEMRVRPGLTCWICPGAGVQDGRRGFAETAVGVNGQRRDAAGTVICDQQTFARDIHGDMTRPAAAGKLLVQQRELAGFAFESKCAHGPGLAHFTDGIEKMFTRRHRQKSWIFGFRREFRHGQPAGG